MSRITILFEQGGREKTTELALRRRQIRQSIQECSLLYRTTETVSENSDVILLTWKRRIMLQISPRMGVLFPSTMS